MCHARHRRMQLLWRRKEYVELKRWSLTYMPSSEVSCRSRHTRRYGDGPEWGTGPSSGTQLGASWSVTPWVDAAGWTVSCGALYPDAAGWTVSCGAMGAMCCEEITPDDEIRLRGEVRCMW